MATTETFGDLKSLLSTLLEDTDTSGLYSTDERERAINNAYMELYNLGINLSDGMGEAATTTSLSVVADTATIALPSNYYRMIDLYYTQTDGSLETLRYRIIRPTDKHKYIRLIARESKQLTVYFRGSNLVLVPTPSWSGTLTMEYYPEPTDLSGSSDEPLFPKSHRELIAYGAYKRLKEKEGMEPSQVAIGIYNDLRAAFERDMEDRDTKDTRRLSGSSNYHIYEVDRL